MKRNSFVASLAAVVMAFSLGAPAAIAATPPEDDPALTTATQQSPELDPPLTPEEPVTSPEEPDLPGEDLPPAGEENENNGNNSGVENSEEGVSTPEDSGKNLSEEEEILLEGEVLEEAIMGAFAAPETLALPAPFPLPMGAATVQPSTVFMRGAGTVDPFLVAGTFVLPDMGTIGPLVEAALIQAVCSEVPAAARPYCEDAFREGLGAVDEMIVVSPTSADVTIDGATANVGVRSAGIPGITPWLFAAARNDFTGSISPGVHSVEATFNADIRVEIPDFTITIPGIPPWIPDISIPIPGRTIDLGNNAIGRLANTPTLTVIDVPDVEASFTQPVGVTLNDQGWDGTLAGTIGTEMNAAQFNSTFTTRAYLFNTNNVQLQSVRLTPVDGVDGLTFEHTFPGLDTGYYYAKVIISSDRLIEIPVTSDPATLQVVKGTGSFNTDIVELECLEETGAFTFSGSFRNNFPFGVRVVVRDADGNAVGSDFVNPVRGSFSVTVPAAAPGTYTAEATVLVPLGYSVTSDFGTSIEVREGVCPALVGVELKPAATNDDGFATNICPADTSDATLVGAVDPYSGNEVVGYAIYDAATDELIEGSGDITVNDDGTFSIPVTDLADGTYYASVSVSVPRGHVESVASNEITVVNEDCGALIDFAWDPNPTANVCPATTASSVFSGTVENYRPGHTVSIAIYEVGATEPLPGWSNDVPINADGTFEFSVEDLADGEYYASVALSLNGTWIETGPAVYLTVENAPCATLGEVVFDPAVATNVCPATTASSTVTGVIENYAGEGIVGVSVWSNEGVLQGGSGDVEVNADGTFAFPVDGLAAGEYYASVTLSVDGVVYYPDVTPELTVEISPCATLGEVVFDPALATNVCPATTASSTVTGVIENYAGEGVVGVGIYAVGSDEPVAGSGDVEVNVDGTFAFPVDGLAAGEYYASVTLSVDGVVYYPDVTPELTVEISPCAEFGEVAFDPEVATNVCPAETASSTLSGVVENYAGETVGFGLYKDVDGTWELVEGLPTTLPVDEDGNFSLEVDGLDAGTYSASVSLSTAEGVWLPPTIAVPLTVEITTCEDPVLPAEFGPVAFDPEVATNVCPAETASSTLTGVIENYTDEVVGLGLYKDVEGEWVLVEGLPTTLPVDEDGNFSLEVDGLDAGTYSASVSLSTADGEWIPPTIAVPLTVEITTCEDPVLPGVLAGVEFVKNPVTNVCPATTAEATLTGTVDGVEPGNTVEVTFDGASTEVAVDEDGVFTLTVEGLEKGEYVAVVNLFFEDELVNTMDVPLTVETTKCTDTPDEKPDNKPDEKPGKPESKPGKPGTLPKTGAAIFPLLLLAGGAGAGGFGLYKVSRRKK